MFVSLQDRTLAETPLNVTAVVGRVSFVSVVRLYRPGSVAPKPAPVMVTLSPAVPDVGDMLVTIGPEGVKGTPLLATPLTVTTTLPGVEPLGTGTTIAISAHVAGVADIPLNVIPLLLCVAPKFVPFTVTDAPKTPEDGEMLVITGATVKWMGLLTWPLTVTTTSPEVAAVGTGTTIRVSLQVLLIVV
jgi:hypothetical protein